MGPNLFVRWYRFWAALSSDASTRSSGAPPHVDGGSREGAESRKIRGEEASAVSLRPFGVVMALVLGWVVSCLGQQPSGPATLESLLGDDVPGQRGRLPDAVADKPVGQSQSPQGALVRPKAGVQHPELDKAWGEYDAAVAKANAPLKAAIAKQFENATAKGDLDAAVKWQAALDKFEQAGEAPAQKETKSAVAAAVGEYRQAEDKLGNAYEVVVKALTMEKKIREARAARNEFQSLSSERNAFESSAKPSPKQRPLEQFFVEALVDGDSELCVTPIGIYWRSLGVAKPGRHGGRNEPTFVNGQAWMPQWGQANQERGRDETALLPLAVGDLDLEFEVMAVGQNRGDRGILARSPVGSRREENKLVVTIPDKNIGSVWYTIRFYRTRTR